MSEVRVVYTDGACSGNPGPGGWAWAVPDGPWASGAAGRTTNQRMELTAALEAVRALDGPLVVRSDSTYVVNCFRDRWWEGWLRRGWVNAKRQPVANRDLWEPLVEAYRTRGDITFEWVKGHGGDPWNDLVDRLAVEAMRRGTGASGDRPPDPGTLGPPDEARSPRRSPPDGTGDAGPAGWALAVVGHRPPALGGWDDHRTHRRVLELITSQLAGFRWEHPDLRVLTGLRPGVEQLAAEAAADLDIPYVAVVPFPDMDAPWPGEARRRYRDLVAGAASTVVLRRRPPAGRTQVAAAFGDLDRWLAEHADGALAVSDGSDPILERLVGRLRQRLDGRVVVVPPASPGTAG